MITPTTAQPTEPRTLRVTGVVRFADSVPAPGTKVQAFDRDLRTERPLGESETDRNGTYRIEYSGAQFLDQERGSADLVVKAFDADGKVLATSPVLFNAPQVAKIDLTIPPERQLSLTLFERIESAVRPLLGKVRVEDLDENEEHQDLTFLSGETGFDERALARFVLAHHLTGLGIVREFWFALLGDSFFDYAELDGLKKNLAAVSTALLGLDVRAVRKALAIAFSTREIPESQRERTEAWTSAFLELVAPRVLGDDKSPSFLRQALDHAGIIGTDRQTRFARLFHRHRAWTPELLAALESEGSFQPEEIADLRTSYELADLTRGDFSVVKMLKEEFDIRRPEQARTLARNSERQWVELIERKYTAGDIKLPLSFGESAGVPVMPEARVYAKTLARQVSEAFPTAAFAGGLERALANGGTRGIRFAEPLARIIERHPEFDLLRTPVDQFLRKGIGAGFESLVKDEAFRRELKAVQRVFKLAPTMEATDALLGDGVHSAQMVYRCGESEFVRRYANRPGFSIESARIAWNRAAEVYAGVVTVFGDFNALDPEGLPAVLKNGNGAVVGLANWENLFQAGDICHCEQCRSVLGPAAYFADLLMFLKDRSSQRPNPNGGHHSVKDILFSRRPDLGYLELNCENALTTLPYVDVVCEVLERVVAEGESDVELADFGVMPAAPDAARAAVAAALSGHAIDVGDEFTLSQVDPDDADRWVVHGNAATYLLKKKSTPNFFAELLPNTKAGSEELRAFPAYVNSKAYQMLRARKHPLALPLDMFPEGDTRRAEQRARSFALPFDLFAEEVRAAFRKCNLQRWDLMRTMRGPRAPNNPTDSEIAAEYFGISSDAGAEFDEKRLILIADPTAEGQAVMWGEPDNAGWLNALANVKTFLRKCGLDYEELLALLDLPFINPAGDIVIRHLEASCDTEQKVIEGLNAVNLDRLDRIHRFLRLWRKLGGWTMWELDLALRCPGIGHRSAQHEWLLDASVLTNLHHLSLLKTRLGTKATIAQLCGLFDDLSTETAFTTLHATRADGLYQSVFLNKRLIQPLDPAFEVAAVDVPGPTAEKISGHRTVILSALGVGETELDVLAGLTRASNNAAAYITDDLTLANLSFLWRHAWLAKALKFTTEEWKTVLKLLQQDVPSFANPTAALQFVENVDHLRATGFTPDELNWLLAADRSAKAAVKEADAARFLMTLRKELQAIRDEHDPARQEILDPPADVDRLGALLTSLLRRLDRDEAGAQFFIDAVADEVRMQRVVAGLPAGFDFPAAIKDAIRIRYDEPTTTVSVTGLMTAAQRDTLRNDLSLAAVTGIAAYQQAIDEFFQTPRLALKFLDPVFAAPLPNLPALVDFKARLDPALAQWVSYDAEERVLRIVGVISVNEKAALDVLSEDADYRNAVNAVFTRPTLGVFPAEELWLQDDDLRWPLRDPDNPANDRLKDNLATAVTKALAYLSRTLSQRLVIRQAGAQLGLTEGLTRRLLSDYAILPDTLVVHLAGEFASTHGAIDHTTLTRTFDGWFWAGRIAALWKKWKLTLAEWEQVRDLTAGAQLLDFATVPLNATAAAAPIERVVRTDRLLRFRRGLPETGITLLEALVRLNSGAYQGPGDFADDVQRLNEAWTSANVQALIGALDLAFPADYLLAESWERVRRASYFVDRLNAAVATVKTFAAAAMGDAHASAIKALLRSKFGGDTWLALSAEMQDALRERKRDALAAYLLTRPLPPADAPTGKWENTNDLYAYYLLDVEMGACQLTSRLVQASGSVQLFVQRCFMGLEPDVTVQADGAEGDTAWRWWKWMRKYRVWEANRKVFLWPENWIEPELKQDRSPFFKDLQNELLQNEINQSSVETAFANYLEKLDGVARLEVAGFYQEDAGDETILHVFGRTSGAEPHLYYYRRYDYRQWTPWEKVDLDVQGNYLIPAVVNKRLFLFWPVFSEVPDEEENSTVRIPKAPESEPEATFSPDKTKKRLRLQMAVSEYRQGKWTPKKVSKDAVESEPFERETINNRYRFLAVDRSEVDERFGIRFTGFSEVKSASTWPDIEEASLNGSFELLDCTGVPALSDESLGRFASPLHPREAGLRMADNLKYAPEFLKWIELAPRTDAPANDLTFKNESLKFGVNPSLIHQDALDDVSVLERTPGRFALSPPWHLSYLDRHWLGLPARFKEGRADPFGTGLPFFYADKTRTFLVLPRSRSGEAERYYPGLEKELRQKKGRFRAELQTSLRNSDPSAWPAHYRQAIEETLGRIFPHELGDQPYQDKELLTFLGRALTELQDWIFAQDGLGMWLRSEFLFRNHYHPFACDFARLVHDPLKGIPALLSRETQSKETPFRFVDTYRPTSSVIDESGDQDGSPSQRYPKEDVDFTPDGAYSAYNWELFFHAPLLIANALSKNQRFEEARDWYHFIFNPLGVEGAFPGGSAMSK